MKIGKTIKEYSFDDEAQSLYVNMLHFCTWLNTRVNKFMKLYRLNKQQYNVLRILSDIHPQKASINFITERMLDKSSNVTRLVDKLVLAGFVTKTDNPANRRIHEVELTEKGVKVLKEIAGNIKELYTFCYEFEPKEMEMLTEKLNMIKKKY